MKKQDEISIGSKIGCYTIIGDNNTYPREPIKNQIVKQNYEKQIGIKKKIINGELPDDYKLLDKYVCRCRCGKEYYLSKEQLLWKKFRYCGNECFTEVVFDNTENYDIDYTNTIHESLKVLECIDDKYEDWYWIDKTKGKRVKHIKLCKKYRCQCYKCGRESIFKSYDFKIRNDERGRNATIGYYSDAYCNCHKISSFQWKTVKILKEHDINYRVEVSFAGLVGIKNLLRYDFGIYNDDGTLKCLIECQGKQHSEPTEDFGGESQFIYQVKNDTLKRQYAKENNIPLIEIPHTCADYEKLLKFLQDNNIIQNDK